MSAKTNAQRITRRSLLGQLALAPIAARGMRWLPGGNPRTLIVVELAGGNDGLNTLIPIDDAAYARARPKLGAVRSGSHPVGDGFALHPAMGRLAKLVERDLCAMIHSVGYSPPDRSHFRSRDIWQSADPDLVRVTSQTTGWLGRAADALAAEGAAVPALSLGSVSVPLALRGRYVVAPALRRIEDYQLLVDPAGGRFADRRQELQELIETSTHAEPGAAADDLSAFLGEVARTAIDSEQRLRESLRGYRTDVEYPPGEFGDSLRLLARVVASSFGTRLFQLSHSGFDTHAAQLGTHANLLGQLADGLAALVDVLLAHDAWQGVTIVVTSEFGRRVAENRSGGTDHGAAGPVFVLGDGVIPGIHGEPPSLVDTVEGDLVPQVDFRRVYAAVLKRLGLGSIEPFGSTQPLTLF